MLPNAPQNAPNQPRKCGGQEGNCNALRHGGRSSRQAFAISHLAANQRGIEGYLHGFRKRLQAEVRRLHSLDYADSLPLDVESAVNLACECEARRRQLGQASREAFESGNEDLGHSRKDEALKWAEKRHAAITEALKPPPPVDPWRAFYASQAARTRDGAAGGPETPGEPETAKEKPLGPSELTPRPDPEPDGERRELFSTFDHPHPDGRDGGTDR